MIDRSHAFPIKGQARMLGLSRSTVYYKPWPVSAYPSVVGRLALIPVFEISA